MELLTGFLLGLVGSLHCAGMCGPLALALPGGASGALNFYAGRLGYNCGRITAYALLGLAVGSVGQSVAWAGLQRWASLAAGGVILAASLSLWRPGLAFPAVKLVAFLKSAFGTLLRRRTVAALYVLGLLNGFLPCGLVYVACAAALAFGSFWSGLSYMVAFGLGTVPMMLGIGLAGKNVQAAIRLRFQKLIPIFMATLALLLILRGLSLGIPYLSPDLPDSPAIPAACH